MNKLPIVIKETYLRHVKSLSFVFMVLSPFLFMAISFGSGYLSSQSFMAAADQPVQIFSEDKGLTDALLEASASFSQDMTDLKSSQQALEAEDIRGILQVELEEGQVRAHYQGKEPLAQEDKAVLTQILSARQTLLNQAQAQLQPEQVTLLNRQPIYEETIQEDVLEQRLAQEISYYGLSFLLYILLAVYISMTAQEIATEKGTKIMEMIFSSLPADQYFYGKMLGILGVLTTHIGIYGLLGGLSYQLLQGQETFSSLSQLVQLTLSHFSWPILLFMLAGLFLYVVISALLGTLVTRIEDINKAVSPVMTLLMAAFFGAMFVGKLGHDHLLLQLGSYLPGFSSFFMPIRLIQGYTGVTQALLSLSVLVLTISGLLVFIAKSYGGLILQTDDLGIWQSFKKGIRHK